MSHLVCVCVFFCVCIYVCVCVCVCVCMCVCVCVLMANRISMQHCLQNQYKNNIAKIVYLVVYYTVNFLLIPNKFKISIIKINVWKLLNYNINIYLYKW